MTKPFAIPSTFTDLFCIHDQAIAPHWVGRVVAQVGERMELELHCRRCGNEVVMEVDELPTGCRTYHVRVTGEDNPQLPMQLRPLPFLEEEFTVVAQSQQEAHERANFVQRMRFNGHVVKYYVDGQLHLDERF